jgi:hypothetical protein
LPASNAIKPAERANYSASRMAKTVRADKLAPPIPGLKLKVTPEPASNSNWPTTGSEWAKTSLA